MGNKKKGFTLIEILAIIVILSIIFSISIPKVLDVIEKSRRRIFFNSATSIVNALKTEYSQNLYNKKFGFKIYEFDKTKTSGYKQNSEKLKLKGDLPSVGTVKLKENGRIALAVVSHDERYCAKKSYSDAEVTVEDYIFGKCNLEADGIIIGEELKITITATSVGTTYLDTATKKEWSTSKDVTITHNAGDRAKLQYQLGTTTGEWIDYNDKFTLKENTTIYARLYKGNNSIESSLTVTTIDREEPKCGKWSGESTTWTNSNRTISVGCSDSQSGCDSEEYSFTYTNTIQTIESKIKISDHVGNSTTCSKDVNVYVDKIPPTCTNSGGSNDWTSGSRTLIGECSDGNSGCINNEVSWKIDWEGNWENLSPGSVSDKAGNVTVCLADQTVKIDRTSPKISDLKINGYQGIVMGSSVEDGEYVSAYLYSSINGIKGTPPYISYTSTDNVGIKTNEINCGDHNKLLSGNNVIYDANEGYTNVNCTVTVTDFAGNSASASTSFKVGSGWQGGDTTWYYYDSSKQKYLTGLQTLNWKKKIGGNLVTRTDKYYFNGDGLMLYGRQEVPGLGLRFFITKADQIGNLPEGSMFAPNTICTNGAPINGNYEDFKQGCHSCFAIKSGKGYYIFSNSSDGSFSSLNNKANCQEFYQPNYN